jgi:hypothetical protein
MLKMIIVMMIIIIVINVTWQVHDLKKTSHMTSESPSFGCNMTTDRQTNWRHTHTEIYWHHVWEADNGFHISCYVFWIISGSATDPLNNRIDQMVVMTKSEFEYEWRVQLCRPANTKCRSQRTVCVSLTADSKCENKAVIANIPKTDSVPNRSKCLI